MKRNDSSSTKVTFQELVRKPQQGWVKVLFLSLQENRNYPSLRSQETLDIQTAKEEKLATQKESPSKDKSDS